MNKQPHLVLTVVSLAGAEANLGFTVSTQQEFILFNSNRMKITQTQVFLKDFLQVEIHRSVSADQVLDLPAI